MFFKAIKINAKVYQIHDPELIPCGLLLRLFGKKIIYDVHENYAEDIFDKPWIKNKKTLFFFYNVFEKIAVKYFTVLLAEYSYEKRYKLLKTNYSVILNYCDLSFFNNYQIPQRKLDNRLFYIGILLESRGLLQIAEAMYLLQQKGIFVYFDVVGELYSDLEKKLVALPFFKKIDSYIIFHGRKNLQEGFEISKNATIGMCIIHPMNNSMESYPTKMFEYMAIGLPQITSNFPLYESVVTKHQCGICVDPLNPNKIANAIENIFDNQIQYESFVANGIKNAAQYNWQLEQEKVYTIYQNVLN